MATRPESLPASAALLIVDLQKAIDAPYWGPRNNPMAERNVARLLAAWRRAGRSLYHIRHDSTKPNSAYRPGQPGHAFKDEAAPLPGETIIVKRVHSAFIGTDLEARLRRHGHAPLIVTGVLTHNSVDATVRMGANLGFPIYVVSDACFAVDKKTLDGRVFKADEVHALTLAILQGEYAEVVDTEWVLARSG